MLHGYHLKSAHIHYSWWVWGQHCGQCGTLSFGSSLCQPEGAFSTDEYNDDKKQCFKFIRNALPFLKNTFSFLKLWYPCTMENTDKQNEEYKTTYNQNVPVFTMCMLSVFFLSILIYFVFKLKCNHTPYYSFQYIFINQWEITNSLSHLSILVFSIVCFHGL